MNQRIDRTLELFRELVAERLPRMEAELVKRINILESKTYNASKVVVFSGTGPPPISNPSQRAWYQSDTDGSRWWYDSSGTWHSII